MKIKEYQEKPPSIQAVQIKDANDLDELMHSLECGASCELLHRHPHEDFRIEENHTGFLGRWGDYIEVSKPSAVDPTKVHIKRVISKGSFEHKYKVTAPAPLVSVNLQDVMPRYNPYTSAGYFEYGNK